MQTASKSIVTLVSFMVTAVMSAQQITATDVCNTMAQNALRDISVASGSEASTSALYQNYCYADGSTNDSNISASGSIVVKALPIGIGFQSASSQSRFTQFCKTYQAAETQQSSNNSYQSLVVTKALDSVGQCLNAAKNNYALSYNVITPSTLAINFSIPSAGVLSVQGIHADTGVLCSGADLLHPGQTFTYEVGKGQNIDSNAGTNAITCVRDPSDHVNGATFYNQKAIIVSTSQGPLNIYWPQETLLPLLNASQIQASIDDLNKRVAAIKINLDLATLPIGSIIPLGSNTATVPQGWIKCDGIDPRAPNLSGKFLRGASAGQSAGASSGNDSHHHEIGVNDPPNTHGRISGYFDGFNSGGTNYRVVSTTESNVPVNMAVLYIMKVQ